MSNVLSAEKREQVVALGRLGWPLRRIEQATGVRRETASAYLQAARIAVRPPGGWGRLPAKAAKQVTTDPTGHSPPAERAGGPVQAKPAKEATTDPETGSVEVAPPERSPRTSACEPYRELIEVGVGRGRNAVAIWQDLVSDHGFAASYESVKRFVGKLRRIARGGRDHSDRRGGRLW